MSTIQTILALLLFLFIISSMNMIFSSPFKEIFSNKVETSVDKGLIKNNKTSGNIIYSGSGFLDETTSYPKGDDQPLFFGFSQK